jgi:hypothetical protein
VDTAITSNCSRGDGRLAVHAKQSSAAHLAAACFPGPTSRTMEGLLAISPFTLPPPPFRIEPEADVAQLVEQPIRNRQVTSSTLVVGSSFPTLTPASYCTSIHCDVDWP